ncbi:hypothetical protein M9458_002873, partial [Cirrhinus mrigala]
QGNRSLEDHTKDFVFLAPMTHYPDSCLCSFYRTGLNTTTQAQLLAAYIEWDDTSPTRDPEPSQPTPQLAEPGPEPTADGDHQQWERQRERSTEPEPIESDQVREPATVPTTADVP